MDKRGRTYRVTICTKQSADDGVIGMTPYPGGRRTRWVRIVDLTRLFTLVQRAPGMENAIEPRASGASDAERAEP